MDVESHFVRLARRGGWPAASSGEKKAFRLAQAIVANVPGLDSRAVAGACQFLRWASDMPMSARDLVDSFDPGVED